MPAHNDPPSKCLRLTAVSIAKAAKHVSANVTQMDINEVQTERTPSKRNPKAVQTEPDVPMDTNEVQLPIAALR